MLKRFILLNYIAVLAISCALSGCLGGTVVQQIARSVVTKVADKAVAKALDVDEDEAPSSQGYQGNHANTALASPSAPQNLMAPQAQANANTAQNPNALSKPYQDTEPDDAWVMLATGGFKPMDEAKIAEVQQLAEKQAEQEAQKQAAELAKAKEETKPLVHVEVLNLLVGAEKQKVYEKARLLGALNLPQAREWQRWHVATGVVEKDKSLITFLIPPQMGKLPSGSKTIVELAGQGDLNIARY